MNSRAAIEAMLAIISDVHSNREALDAVLEDLPDEASILCLGDVVGYGPDPAYCIERLRERNVPTVRGNHEEAVSGDSSMAVFRPEAIQAAAWQRSQLGEKELEWLKGLPRVIRQDDLTLTHEVDGSGLSLPFNGETASMFAAQFSTRFVCFGHTHLPLVAMARPLNMFRSRLDWTFIAPEGGGMSIRASSKFRMLINPGSVGQPRDGIAMASYVLLNLPKCIIQIRRVPYDFSATMAKLRRCGLPESLAIRLATGL